MSQQQLIETNYQLLVLTFIISHHDTKCYANI